MLDDLQEKRDLVLKTAREHGIKNVRVFGSVARSEDNSASDLDLLVDFEEGRTLFDLIRFKQDMEQLFNRKVDVVTENAVHWRIKDNVINGAVPL
ncbi:nucleotidyltransferase family protein [Salibacterium aidingense]|uniref:nucleotidyltransferase family protein n=1 Tax=Salibacterium aidingense TaxID=384933 RepID=UPI00041F4FF4|nr:nucleotidyltransferase family protein [Salibacterium aidingense]